MRNRPPLIDGWGRTVDDLRVSVTDKCNFRCTYCMPPQGLPWLPKDAILTFEEITRVAAVFVSCGIRSIKLTGGEPLVRRDLHVLIRMLRDLDAGLDISLTTNGYLLAEQAPALADAGLDRVSVSCDSLLRHRFTELTLRDALAQVRRGIRVAAAAGLTPLKVNVVVMRNRNDDELIEFARLARDTGYDVRFIEYMPLDAQGAWSSDQVVPGVEIVERIDAVFPLRAAGRRDGDPATRFVFADGAGGSIGVIPSVTEPFCSSCNRVRVTADGNVRACLFSVDESDVKRPMRAGADDDELEELIRDCVARKWAGHRIGQADFVRPSRSMSMIGG